MKDEIVLLAVTKMLSGFCIGGISRATGKWVRPVKEYSTIIKGDYVMPMEHTSSLSMLLASI